MNTLIIGSGGVKGFCYLGACKALDDLVGLETMGRIVGCSIGSMIGVLLCVGYNPKEIFREFLTVNFEEMLVPGDLKSIIEGVGVFENTKMRDLIWELIRKRIETTTLTFHELYEKTGREFYVVATDMDHMESRVFSPKTTPDTSVVEAVVASCSIPFVVQGCVVDGSFTVDGASVDPVGLEYALENPSGIVYCMFFANRPFAEKISEIAGIPDVMKMWGDWAVESVYRKPFDKILGVGAKLIQCFTEALTENYILRCVYQNRLSPHPTTIRLIPLPNTGNMLFCDSETKVRMYFTGEDVIESLPEKYLGKNPVG
jgi:predicted acylesterase/phospholipase RssA